MTARELSEKLGEFSDLDIKHEGTVALMHQEQKRHEVELADQEAGPERIVA
jgi:hypothetical protein